MFPTVQGALQGPGGPVVPGVPGGLIQDLSLRRPFFKKTAVLGVDGRAPQSQSKWDIPVGPGKDLQGPAVTCRARPSPTGPYSYLQGPVVTYRAL